MSDEWSHLPPIQTGIRGLCPRCGQGHIFNGFLALKDRCEVCDLDYSFADPADGPAFFVICFTSIPALAIASYIEVKYSPGWVHFITSVPIVLLSCLLPLRPLKGWLVNSQYFYKAEEGKIDYDYTETTRSSHDI
ncbi:uncharacterized protein (DUF983 family) [Agrobacterium pusense]|uniref:DUF983 domain-containing protein n=1 Tax=Agrobacterium pusense TaxID=648995 RepID=UPI0028640BFE|nr:DUF983 domain-containing protein [Agrobacterium pusense]MDR6192894.1 uncharacterized protein (DUF983 family) [Agrobacterium pusense]